MASICKLQLAQHLIGNIVGINAEGIDQRPFQPIFFGAYHIQDRGAVGAGIVTFKPEIPIDLKFIVKYAVLPVPALQAILLQVKVFFVSLLFQVGQRLNQIVV